VQLLHVWEARTWEWQQMLCIRAGLACEGSSCLVVEMYMGCVIVEVLGMIVHMTCATTKLCVCQHP
jgi:hypothetical protein